MLGASSTETIQYKQTTVQTETTYNQGKNIQRKIYRKKNVHRQNCECACVLCTDEGLMSYLQMYSTVCYVLFRWDTAWGKKTILVSGCFCAQ